MSGMYTGIWTPWNEEWFRTRLRDIANGTAAPMNTRKWRSALGQYRPCAKLVEATNARSAGVLDQYLAAGLD